MDQNDIQQNLHPKSECGNKNTQKHSTVAKENDFCWLAGKNHKNLHLCTEDRRVNITWIQKVAVKATVQFYSILFYFRPNTA